MSLLNEHRHEVRVRARSLKDYVPWVGARLASYTPVLMLDRGEQMNGSGWRAPWLE
jgi:hypothetical protein